MNLRVFAFLLFVKANAGQKNEEARKSKILVWDDELKQCQKPPTVHVQFEYACISYLWNYELINLELLNGEPPVIVYRGLLSKEDIKGFVADIRDEQGKLRARSSDSRHTMEFTMGHTSAAGAARVFKKLSMFIPFIDFNSSDPWQVLLFKKGGNIAPRHDYLSANPTDEQDVQITQKLGNRFATLSITLEKAEQGGEEHSMEHGDCPVKNGAKITATLRLRERGQYLLMSAWPGGFYDYSMLVRPDPKFLGVTPKGW